MPGFTYRIATVVPDLRSVAVAALLGAAMLASPYAVAQTASPPAQTAPTQAAPAHAAPRTAAAKATSSQPETVEQRITDLHRELKITPAEETQWTAVAQTMRDNAAAMQKLITEREADQPMTAMDDLNSYGKFAQAHADGVKNLMTSFDALYGAMPDAQKKVTDQVFGVTRHQRG